MRIYSRYLVHRGRFHETSFERDRMRPLRARLVTSHSGGSGTPLGRHYGRPARSSLDWPARMQVQETRSGADGGFTHVSIRLQMPQWSAGRRTHRSQGACTPPTGVNCLAPLGAPLPHFGEARIRRKASPAPQKIRAMERALNQNQGQSSGRTANGIVTPPWHPAYDGDGMRAA